MRSAVTAVLAALLLLPSLAVAQSNPFTPLPQAPPEAPAPLTTPADEGISGAEQALLIAGGIILVLGIGFAIARDARRNAPGDPRPGRRVTSGPATVDGVEERRRPDPRSASKQKAAAKRARQARKKNRPVRK